MSWEVVEALLPFPFALALLYCTTKRRGKKGARKGAWTVVLHRQRHPSWATEVATHWDDVSFNVPLCLVGSTFRELLKCGSCSVVAAPPLLLLLLGTITKKVIDTE